MRTVEDHERDYHGAIPTTVAAVQGCVIYPRDVPHSMLDEMELRTNITAVRDRMKDAHGLTFDVLPIKTIEVEQDVAWFSDNTNFGPRTRDVLGGPLLVPTIGWVVGMDSNSYIARSAGASNWIATSTSSANILMHELGHCWLGMLGEMDYPPREVKSWWGFGPSTYTYDIMSVHQTGAEITAYIVPLDQVEFAPPLVPGLKRSKYLRAA